MVCRLQRCRAGLFVTAVVGACLVPTEPAIAEPPAPAPAADTAFFETRIRPVLAAHCLECHSAGSPEPGGGLLLDRAAGWQTGGDSGPAIVPGDSGSSLLLAALRYESLEMPPSGRLPSRVIDDFKEWIDRGAADPRDGSMPETLAARAAGEIDWEAARAFWSFVPPRHWPTPAVARADWPIDPVDAFVLARLEQAGLNPAAAAAPSVLLRRLSYDLTGLPPSPDLVAAFAADPSPAHYRRIVDELLLSRAAAEHQARHWLDVARYADSNGSDFNATFHDAWRYREFVISAFEKDMPFDQFVVRQVAGDLLEEADPAAAADNLVATGFLMLGTKMLSERDKDKLEMDVVDDMIDTCGRGFLGLTLGCARCHDHKFDPIPTEDYYALAGIFRSTVALEGESQKYVSTWVKRPLPAEPAHAAAVAKHEEARAAIAGRLAAARKRLAAEKRAVAATAGTDGDAIAAAVSPVAAPSGQSGEEAGDDEPRRERIAAVEAEVKAIEAELKALEAGKPPPLPLAMAVKEANRIGNAFVCVRGEVDNRGPEVPRGFLRICSTGPAPQLPGDRSGRLELARWLTAPDNPLAARVIVNRIWMHLLGEGLVRTVDNFGVQGERPSHPELLDTLAIEFVRDGWSIRRLVRRLVLTRTYAQASAWQPVATAAVEAAAPPDPSQVDPENRLLWRAHRRRMPAEAVRDTLLLAAGLLDPSPAVAPMAGFGTLVTQNVATPGEVKVDGSNHRSIYLPVIRGMVHPLLATFDFADPDLLVGRREATNVPAQALVLLNNPEVRAWCERIAARIVAGAGDDPARVRLAYRLLVQREPDADEAAWVVGYLQAPAPAAGDRWPLAVQAIVASTAFRFID